MILLEILLKSAVIMATAAALTTALRRRPAASRSVVWTLALLTTLVLPVVTLSGLAWSPGWLTEAQLVTWLSGDVEGGPVASDVATMPSAVRVLGVIWLLGSMILLARLAVGLLQLRRFVRSAPPVLEPGLLAEIHTTAKSLGIQRPIQLRWAASGEAPVTWGFVYPTLLVPAAMRTWATDRRRAVLLHELAHIRRFDALSLLVARLAVLCYWPNPLVWVAARRLEAEHEHASDDCVLRAGVLPSDYVSHLVAAARATTARMPLPAAALSALGRAPLPVRARALLDESRTSQVRRRALLPAIAVGFALIVAPVAAFTVQPVRQPAALPPVSAPDLIPARAPNNDRATDGGTLQASLRSAQPRTALPADTGT
jgi:beta-lactamase regulating signal transducer with metallopeptidase domain